MKHNLLFDLVFLLTNYFFTTLAYANDIYTLGDSQPSVKITGLASTKDDELFNSSTNSALLKLEIKQQHSDTLRSLEEQTVIVNNVINNQSNLAEQVVINNNNNGEPPSLQPQPIQPGQQPFQPQKVPTRSREKAQLRYAVTPAITSVIPSAYGKNLGDTGIAVGFQERTRYTQNSDGNLGFGFGLGNAKKNVGLDVGITLSDHLSNITNRGYLSFKLHRTLPNDLAVALGWQNAVEWGQGDAGSSVYGVATKRIALKDSVEEPFSRLYLSAGIGNGQFRSESEINQKIDSLGVFGSVALRVAEPANLIAEWTGQDLTIGVSYVPFKKIPLVVTPALTDITQNAGDGARFIVSVGYGFTFK